MLIYYNKYNNKLKDNKYIKINNNINNKLNNNKNNKSDNKPKQKYPVNHQISLISNKKQTKHK